MSEHAMTSAEFLRWLQQRLINVYGEDENTDFVLKISEIASEVERLERERDEALRAKKDFAIQMAVALGHKVIAEARVTALTMALRRYGQHTEFCKNGRSTLCVCGLDALLASPEPGAPTGDERHE